MLTTPLPRLRPAVWPPLVLTLMYTLAAAVGAVATGNGEFVFYVIVMAVLIGVVGVVHAQVNLSLGVLWCLAAWGAMHMAGGLVPVPEAWPIQGDIRVLYSWRFWPVGSEEFGLLKYDQFVHAFGFGTTTWVCWQGLAAAVGPRRPTLGLLMLCATAAMGFGALNEVVEFIATLLGPTNVGGYINTGLDLVANAAGAFVAAILIAIGARRDGEPLADATA